MAVRFCASGLGAADERFGSAHASHAMPLGARTHAHTHTRTARVDAWTDGRAGGRTDGLAGGQDKEHMRRLLTSKGCREEVVAEVCAAAYSVMPPPGRAARTDSDQERTVRLASKTRMNDKSKQNKS